MHILMTGGTGFIGNTLLPHLNHDQVTVLSRTPHKAYRQLGHHIKVIPNLDTIANLNDFDVVINLAGEPIMNRRWTAGQKQRICDSRWLTTQQLVEKWQASSSPPHTIISGSAVGIYGDQAANTIDEDSETCHHEFAAQVCQKWESLALSMQSEQTRVCILRTGIVLGRHGGALAKMLPAYQLGLGGPISTGRQYFPWIHLQDMVKGILFLIKTSSAHGIFNFTAPNPVTNREFSQTLAKVLKRPHLLYTPSWALRMGLGESASLLLDSQRVIPKHLQTLGFHFTFPLLDNALKSTLYQP